MVRGLPNLLRFQEPSYFFLTNCLNHLRSVSGEKTYEISNSIFLPTRLASTANLRLCLSFKIIRFLPVAFTSSCFMILFSSIRKFIASCCCRFIQPANIMSNIFKGFSCIRSSLINFIRLNKRKSGIILETI